MTARPIRPRSALAAWSASLEAVREAEPNGAEGNSAPPSLMFARRALQKIDHEPLFCSRPSSGQGGQKQTQGSSAGHAGEAGAPAGQKRRLPGSEQRKARHGMVCQSKTPKSAAMAALRVRELAPSVEGKTRFWGGVVGGGVAARAGGQWAAGSDDDGGAARRRGQLTRGQTWWRWQ